MVHSRHFSYLQRKLRTFIKKNVRDENSSCQNLPSILQCVETSPSYMITIQRSAVVTHCMAILQKAPVVIATIYIDKKIMCVQGNYCCLECSYLQRTLFRAWTTRECLRMVRFHVQNSKTDSELARLSQYIGLYFVPFYFVSATREQLPLEHSFLKVSRSSRCRNLHK
jgi:hypothetical protein